MIGKVFEFTKRVLEAVKKGGLSSRDRNTLDRILTNDRKRSKVLAAGLVSALKIGATAKDVEQVSLLFEKAGARISDEKPPFTKSEAETLRGILSEAGVSEKTSSWVSKHVDEMLAREIQEFISGKSIERGFVPSKKSFSIVKNQKIKEQKPTIRLGEA